MVDDASCTPPESCIGTTGKGRVQDTNGLPQVGWDPGDATALLLRGPRVDPLGRKTRSDSDRLQRSINGHSVHDHNVVIAAAASVVAAKRKLDEARLEPRVGAQFQAMLPELMPSLLVSRETRAAADVSDEAGTSMRWTADDVGPKAGPQLMCPFEDLDDEAGECSVFTLASVLLV